MAVTLIVETGAGVTGANTYISLAGAETYFESRLNASVWDGETDDNKNRALVQATRALDANNRWKGTRVDPTVQALEWPRDNIYIDDDAWPSSSIPADVANAAAELSLYLLSSDRTADNASSGLKSLGVGSGAVELVFDNATETDVLPETVMAMLWRWVTSSGSSNAQPKTRRV